MKTLFEVAKSAMLILPILSTQPSQAATQASGGTPTPIIIVSDNDPQAQRNAQNVLEVYQKMINEKQPYSMDQYMAPGYIQHNPTLATGRDALEKAFAAMEAAHPTARVVVYRVIAAGNYVFAHVNFLNLFTDDPTDRGLAGIDIYRFDDNGIVQEHWDVLQAVPDPSTSANTNGMF
jgi:predicted SnoaL-like aldol condensation-catalyzing enzyme